MASYRDYLYEHVNLTSSSSTVKAISASSWLNGIIYCSAVGEITAMLAPQLLFGLDYDKKLKSYIYVSQNYISDIVSVFCHLLSVKMFFSSHLVTQS